uniref:NADH-ubiquinone oxidoreductase chain 2 n=1 Tax=Hoplodactylus sp. Three Kings TaxID=946314 RepID=F2VMW3_9SAUR|nr:NADH dehydrogenase subunit 2 [Hoplodactylus sp. Three Kings]
MNPTTWFLLMLSLISGTIITLSSSHWILAWAGLEMNTLAIIPLISKQHHPRATEAATKYFLTQATASAMILFASSMNAWKTGQWSIFQLSLPEATILLTLALAMKLGLAPFHFWLPETLQGTTLLTATLISTWQKLAPSALLLMTINNLNQQTLMIVGLFSAIMGGWLGLNQTQTRKIMAFSSIAHMGWMFTALSMHPNLALITLFTYLVLTTTMFLTLTMTASKTLLDLGTTWSQTPALLTTSLLSLMSLGGLPPFTGLPKWLILNELMTDNLYLLSTTMALSTLPSLFFYLRMSHMTALTTPPKTTNNEYKWRLKSYTLPTMTGMILMSITLLPITPMITNII